MAEGSISGHEPNTRPPNSKTTYEYDSIKRELLALSVLNDRCIQLKSCYNLRKHPSWTSTLQRSAAEVEKSVFIKNMTEEEELL